MVGSDLLSPVVEGVNFYLKQTNRVYEAGVIVSFIIHSDTQRVLAGEQSSSPTKKQLHSII